VGTMADNMQDKVLKGRTTQGEDHYHAKLTNSQRQQIKQEFAQARDIYGSIKAMARHYGVDRSQIYRVNKNPIKKQVK